MKEIQFPIEVNQIKTRPFYRDINKPDSLFCKCGQLVSIRPCDDKYGKKTFLGILLGDLPLELSIHYEEKEKELYVSGYSNPAIFVPELGQIIWGCESWWGAINSEEELKKITDKDIQDVWYVKLLKTMLEKKTQDESISPS